MRLQIEALENRVMLDTVELGTLVGRRIVTGSIGLFGGGDFELINFTLAQPAWVHYQLSNITAGTFVGLDDFGEFARGTNFIPDIRPARDRQLLEAGDHTVTMGLQPLLEGASGDEGDISGTFGTSYHLSIAADTALPTGGSSTGGDSRVIGASQIDGRDLGVLTTRPGAIDISDFIGTLDNNHRSDEDIDNDEEGGLVDDPFDNFLFTIPRNGEVDIRITDTISDLANGLGTTFDVTLARDLDGDGRFNEGASDRIDAVTLTSGENERITENLNAGRYMIQVRNLGFTGSNNYRLRVNYDFADQVGDTLATARNVGPLSALPIPFSDYLAPLANDPNDDLLDIHRIDTGPGGPFAIEATLSGMDEDSNFDIELIRDANGNGIAGANERVAISNRTANSDESIIQMVDPGTFFLIVRRQAGEGVYTLTLSSRNTDFGKNTLAAGPVTVLGIGSRIAEQVNASDTVDLYRVVLSKRATIQASFPKTAKGTNADLALIQDRNTDNVIDSEEVLAVSANAGDTGESLSRLSDPGTYVIRVLRVSGSPKYNLLLNIDEAGSAPVNALSLNPNGGGKFEAVVPNDTVDVFRVTLGNNTRLLSSLSSLTNSVRLEIARDFNNNSLLDSNEILLSKVVQSPLTTATEFSSTASGVHFVRITAVGAEGTIYGLRFDTSPIDRAGNSPGAARDIGEFGSAVQSFSDFVGDGSSFRTTDVDDFYRFTPAGNGPFIFSAQLSGLNSDASLQLIRDADGDGVLDSGEAIRTSANPGTASDQINQPLFSNEPLFVRVFRVQGSTSYTLTLNAVSLDEAENTLTNARDLGTAGELAISGVVGPVDPEDFFKFSVASAGTLYAWIVPTQGDVDLQIIRDANNNGQIDAAETIAASGNVGTAAELINNVVLPAAGDYFARASQAGSLSSYSMTLRFTSGPAQTPFGGNAITISPTDAVKIEAERFDEGGEGVAFHDSDSNNQDGAFRNNVGVDIAATPDSGGGFRISNIRAGEFLEYTVSVPTGGFYDFNFRVGSPEPGAVFHMEVDNLDVTGPLTIPDTDGFDNFVFVNKQSVALGAGPHIFKLAFDVEAPANSRVGTINLFKVRPTAAPVAQLSALADSFVRGGGFDASNFGTQTELLVKQAGGDGRREAYIKFDLGSVSTIGTAKLRLVGRLHNSNSVNVATQVFSAGSNWEEDQITFLNRPALGASSLASTIITDTTFRTYEWDVTAFLQAEKAAGRNLVTLVLKNPVSSSPFTVFHSREALSDRPQLVISP